MTVPLPAQTIVCLVRHGETDWNKQRRLQGREDVPLNARGREQAALTAAYLAAQAPWDLIVTSPLRRASETAAIIRRQLGDVPLTEMDELVEHDYGAASGLTPEEIRESFPDGVIPGREDRQAARERAMRALHTIIDTYPGQRILVVAHGGVINGILSTLSNSEIGSGKTVLHNACLSVLRFSQDRWEIDSHNVTEHLEPLTPSWPSPPTPSPSGEGSQASVYSGNSPSPLEGVTVPVGASRARPSTHRSVEGMVMWPCLRPTQSVEGMVMRGWGLGSRSGGG